jgi:glutathione S-transferase
MPDDWASAFADGSYTMSTRDRTLAEEGFIHCSTRDQLVDTANRFYGDVEHLVLLTIDPGRVGSPVVFEPPAPGVDELFPHVYGPVPIAAVVAATSWTRDVTDSWQLELD